MFKGEGSGAESLEAKENFVKQLIFVLLSVKLLVNKLKNHT
jgi:hypothetical protein